MTESKLTAFRELPAEEQARRRKEVRVLILTGLGLNCEVETEAAFRLYRRGTATALPYGSIRTFRESYRSPDSGSNGPCAR